ncbi:hypothetical protein AV530_007919 [Patagioenas fasciata monilis]|uniref:Uncharacterized protein n=1 Tax=Patagioenas fasciata monilis TaxID=372326 RepID=A0A1V4JI03_PATFA|nr:hypothetical protein AV530_007919 [Patagioenas fasciata monilis]
MAVFYILPRDPKDYRSVSLHAAIPVCLWSSRGAEAGRCPWGPSAPSRAQPEPHRCERAAGRAASEGTGQLQPGD